MHPSSSTLERTGHKRKRSLTSNTAQPSSLLKIPLHGPSSIQVRFAKIEARDNFIPREWSHFDLSPDAEADWYSIDLNGLNLPDGTYEYEFIANHDDAHPIPDPFAEEITRFGGYRGIFTMKDGRKQMTSFRWNESPETDRLLMNNHQLVIYELPLRWTSTESDIQDRQVGLGDFDHALFAHLPTIAATGFNAIELLPVQDSTDTINWGYGTRFFFAPDYDMGTPVELKAFIKKCHQLGIRVILDVVMNHAKKCPLEKLAKEWYFLDSPSEEGRDADWGGKCFRFAEPKPDDRYLAREFLYRMAHFWVREYHIDGFRIDEFKGIQNYDFLQQFTENAWDEHNIRFPHRPFIVIAEDSARRSAITEPSYNGRRVVNAMWDFNYRAEARKAISDAIVTQWGEPSRRQRVSAMISGLQSWNEWNCSFDGGFGDMGRHIIYQTSHDVEKPGEQRLINYLLIEELAARGWTDLKYTTISKVIDGYVDDHSNYATPQATEALNAAFERARSTYCLLMTSVGIPMLLAGEEFGDTHDTNHEDWRQKMSDVVNYARRGRPRHLQLEQNIAELIALRKSHPALLRNEVSCFYFHPTFDDNYGERVAAYCRTAGKPLYSDGQVVVVANFSRRNYPGFILPWKWPSSSEQAISSQGGNAVFYGQHADISLLPGQVRVFTT